MKLGRRLAMNPSCLLMARMRFRYMPSMKRNHKKLLSLSTASHTLNASNNRGAGIDEKQASGELVDAPPPLSSPLENACSIKKQIVGIDTIFGNTTMKSQQHNHSTANEYPLLCRSDSLLTFDGNNISVRGRIEGIRKVNENLFFITIKPSLLPPSPTHDDTNSHRQLSNTDSLQILCSNQIVSKDDYARLYEMVIKEGKVSVHSQVQCFGVLSKRPKKDQKLDDRLGSIELHLHSLELVNKAKPLMFHPSHVKDEGAAGFPLPSENIRLSQRWLDLRRPQMQKMLIERSQLNRAIRSFFQKNNFLEVETPTLTPYTPEGAKQFRVTSGAHNEQEKHKQIQCLVQSPQIYKQLLMASDCPRYYQLARCYRREDGRSDRQPEFTQLDVEASWMRADDIESLIRHFLDYFMGEFGKITGKSPKWNFSKYSYKDALCSWGSDKPDLRYPFCLETVVDGDGNISQAIDFSSSTKGFENGLAARIQDSHLPLIFLKDDRFLDELRASHPNICIEKQSPTHTRILCPLSKKSLTLPLYPPTTAGIILARIIKMAEESFTSEMSALKKTDFAFTWIHLFPLFKPSKDGQSDGILLESMHHPFTAPITSAQLHDSSISPFSILAQHYDLVLNGCEVGGGSVRIHKESEQKHIFSHFLKMSNGNMNTFGHLLSALGSGCPPHAGIAIGVDRLYACLMGKQSIRDVIAFPKNSAGKCLMADDFEDPAI